MPLRSRSIFDPRFTSAIASVAEGGMTSSVLIRRFLPSSNASTRFDFDEGKNESSYAFLALGIAPARVQPSKDWRARGYEMGNEPVVFQAVRFQIPLTTIEWNEDVPVEERDFRDEDQLVILQNFFPALEKIKRFVFVVRNPLISGNAGSQNLLCDANLKNRFVNGNPEENA